MLFSEIDNFIEVIRSFVGLITELSNSDFIIVL